MTPTSSSEADLPQRILDTTRHLLVAEGYAALSMRKIARAVGVSATSIYLYFENKDDLFHALIDEGMEQLFTAMQEAADRFPGDPAARLRALCEAYVAFGLAQPERYEIMFMLHPARPTRYPAEKYRRARRNLDLIEAAVAEGAARGLFAVERPDVSACTVWATLHGAVSLLLARRLDVAIEPETFVETTLHQTLRSLAWGEALSPAPG